MATQDVQHGRLKEVCTQCGKSYAEGTRYCPQDGSELMSTMADPLIGVVLPRRYRILSMIGRGSMSVVYKGSYEPLDQLVAIKMLKSHLVSDPHQNKRFQQEIKTAGALSHPNIVGILDFGVTEQGVPYLIMEHLEGKSLSEILEKDERISVNRAIRIFSQCADGLAYAHRAGVVHRDIKPSNILIIDTEEEKDVVKIVDFGIAKIQGNVGASATEKTQNLGLTATGEVIGTPLYMSPEQSQGKDLDGRSDIYALGCVMYHALTGKPPFVGDTALDTIRMQISSAATPIDVVRPDLYFPERFQSIITRALAKDPRMRYQRMEHLQIDVEACAKKTESMGIRAVRKDDPTPIQPMPTAKPRLDISNLGLPALCVIVGVAITVGVVGWGILTDVGKKQPKISLPIATDGTWRSSQAAAESAFGNGRFEDAEHHLKEALIEAKKFKQPDARVATTLNYMAELYYSLDNLPEAQKACEQALSTARAVSPTEPSVAEALHNLSRVQTANGELEKAESTAKAALALREKTLGGTHYDVASSMRVLAELECKRGHFDKAGEILTRALAIAQKALGEDNPETASIVHDLGMVREHQGNYTEAKTLFKRALGVRQKALGMNHPSVSDTMCALGTLSFNQRDNASAEAMFDNALNIRMQAYGERSSKTAEIYSCLAILYDTEKKYNEAEECYRKAVQIREALWGSESPRLLRSLEHLAKFLREHNQKQGAEVYEAQIKRIKKNA